MLSLKSSALAMSKQGVARLDFHQLQVVLCIPLHRGHGMSRWQLYKPFSYLSCPTSFCEGRFCKLGGKAPRKKLSRLVDVIENM